MSAPDAWNDADPTLCTVCQREGCEDHLQADTVEGPAVEGPAAPIAPAVLEFQTFKELAAEVDAAGPRRWLVRGIFPAGDYGVHAAEKKAQKTWNIADLAVSVASGTPWLGSIPVDDPGPVVLFLGEGGKSNAVRRVRALAKARGLKAEDLQIVVCARAPHLNDTAHVAAMTTKIAAVQPRLVVIDPFYLSARGADLKDLYGMGALLETPQRICQGQGAALLIVTHFNRGQGQGAARITGAGPAEWGRVLISATVVSKRTDPTTKATRVLTELEIIGGEIPDQILRIHRHIWTDDPDDLNSPMHVETAATVGDQEETSTAAANDLAPAERKLLEALQAATEPLTSSALVDLVALRHGHGLKRETASKALNELERRGHAVSTDPGSFKPKLWAVGPCDRAVPENAAPITRAPVTRENPSKTPCDVRDITRDGHARKTRVTSCDHTLKVVTHGHASDGASEAA